MLTNKSTCHVAILTFICMVQVSGDLWTRVSTPEYLCRRSATEKCPYPHAHTANPPIPMHFSHYRWNHGSVPRCPRRVPTMEKCRVEWNPSARLNCSSTGFVVSRVVSFENLSDVDTARNFDRSKRWISRSFEERLTRDMMELDKINNLYEQIHMKFILTLCTWETREESCDDKWQSVWFERIVLKRINWKEILEEIILKLKNFLHKWNLFMDDM